MTIVIKRTEDIEKLKKLMKSVEIKGKFNARKYCGIIKLEEDPMKIQKRMRDEWE